MPAFDDDDELESYSFEDAARARRGREGSWDVEDEGPDDRDFAPDTFSTTPCTSCHKLIFEDSVRCPYCKDLQLEAPQNRRPVWIWIVTGLLALTAAGAGVFWFLCKTLWHTL